MKARVGSTFRLTAPLKAAFQRFALASFMATAFILMLLSKAEVPLVEKARIYAADLLIPVFDVMSRPVGALSDFADETQSLWRLKSENARLRAEIDVLRQWQDVARRLDTENRALRALLNFADPRVIGEIAARVVADSGGAYVRNLLISVGGRDGVTKGQVAVTGDGVIGRVTEVGERSARVLLLTDLNSKIPVMVESTGDRALLVGDNTALPRLAYLPQDARVQPGDRIVTSSHGGALPQGVPVGQVVAVGDRGVQVRPFADWQRLEYLRLLDYGLSGGPILTGPAQR